MMSYETIQALSREQGRKARRLGKKPRTFASDAEVEREHRTVPFLGDYTPRGWRHLQGRDLFVDKSGLGQVDEPALTESGFVDRILELRLEDPAYGFAIIEEGQFQVYVGVFQRQPGAGRKRTVRVSATPLPPVEVKP